MGELSRRDFLKLGTAAFASLAFRRQISSLDKVSRNAESLEPTNIEGIKVYGNESPIQDKDTFQTIMASEQEEFWPGVNKLFTNLSRQELIHHRETLLPKNERFIDVVIPESVYKKVPDQDKVRNFPAWLQYQMDGFNFILKRDIPGLDLTIIPKRILVVSDSLTPDPVISEPHAEATGWTLQNSSDGKWMEDNLGRLPIDTDLRIHFEKDYPQTEKAYGQPEAIISDGKLMLAEFSMFHHRMMHPLFHLPDWYWHSGDIISDEDYFQNISAYQNDIMGGIINKVSPATATHILSSVNRFDFRGVHCDDLPKNFVDTEIPPNATLSMKLPDGSNPKVAFFNYTSTQFLNETFWEHHANIQYHSLPVPFNIENDGDNIKLTRDVLDMSFPYLIAGLSFPGEEDKPFLNFPIPRLLFRLATWQQLEDPQFNIQFTDQVYPVGKRLVLETVWKKDLEDYKKEHERDLRIFAHCEIPNTEAVNIWAWREFDIKSAIRNIVVGGTGTVLAFRKLEKSAEQSRLTANEKRERIEEFDRSVNDILGKTDMTQLVDQDGHTIADDSLILNNVSKETPLLVDMFKPTILVLTDNDGIDSIVVLPALNRTFVYDHYNWDSKPRNQIGILVSGSMFGLRPGETKVARATNKNYFVSIPSSSDGVPWNIEKGSIDIYVGNKLVKIKLPWHKESNVTQIRVGKIKSKLGF
ncbi:hypothetical protein COY20_04675 [Candidatus Shapirobacteria bacterium CG_4_10_14_0_2_um_filter_40_12]|uniref:Uncharacterized protein n=1 Tax=Candidatus Shapirobacteria bacterium CG_4_10_14_0_2_um_filter_40_12 TaxID=1974871 RepID=A0A2M7TRD4_9BACT|nr:MAG: hypothetical protein COY20_04675 [Candidatus Shapirobacteria bacterium CG_4_10_14_0_2_um_filter_40_12]